LNAQPDWFRTFFRGLFVEFWLAAPTPEQTEKEADFLQEMLQIAPPARLLDVPCGGGRHALSLAARGYRMTGVDISPEFLAAAKKETKSRSAEITWEQREMRDLPGTASFDGAYCLGNSFGYDDEEGNAAFLHAVARSLKPGARYVLDTGYVLEALLPTLQDRSWYEIGGMLALSQRRYDPETGRLTVEYTLIQNDVTEKRTMSARLYTVREISGLLADAGFTDVQRFSSLEKEPFKVGSHRLLVVATKA
jgi:SAM-dependent methyltransferase